MTKRRAPMEKVTSAANPPYQQKRPQAGSGGSIWPKRLLNKLPEILPRTHLLCIMKALASVNEKIQEAKGLGSEVNPALKRRRKLLRRVRESMKACNACD